MENTLEKIWLSPEIELDHRKKSRKITIGIFLLMIILMFFTGIAESEIPESNEGIYINFGNSETGSGQTEPDVVEEVTPKAAPTPAQPDPTPTEVTATDDVEGVDVEATPEPAPIKKEEKKVEEQVKKKVESEEIVKKEEPKIDPTKTFDPSRFKKSGESQGDNPGTTGNKGQEDGGEGTEYFGKNRGKGKTGFGDLDIGNGRDWAKRPYLNEFHQVRDKLILEITVDKDGNIIRAAPARGSTLTDQSLIEEAIRAVKRAKITPDPNGANLQKGKVTFDFKLQ